MSAGKVTASSLLVTKSMSKGFFYIDDSIHDNANFILCACCYLSSNPDLDIKQIIISNGFNPENFEYSSGDKYHDAAQLQQLRSGIYNFISDKCSIGIVVAPLSARPKIGEICIEATNNFIIANGLVDKVDSIFIDQGMNLNKAQRILDGTNITIYTEQNSLQIRGIQLADYCAHTLSTWLKGSMGILNKKVSVNGLDTEIHFEMFARLRYILFKKQKNLKDFPKAVDLTDMATFEVEPYGLHICEELDDATKKLVRDTFSRVYMGCIH